MRPTLLIGLLTLSACAPRAATYTTIPVQDLRAAQERAEGGTGDLVDITGGHRYE